MSSHKAQAKTLWVATFVAVVIVVAVVFGALQLRSPSRPFARKTPKPEGATVISRVDKTASNALKEWAELSDLSPLFLPTPVNTSEVALPATLQREPSAAFGAVPPQLTFDEFQMQVVFPDPIPLPGNPVAALSLGNTPNPYFTMGRENHPYTPLPKRVAFIEVLDVKTGSMILSRPLDVPSSSPLPPGLWQPLELVAAVDTTGLVGELTVTSSSGVEPVDTFFRQFVAKEFRLGERLRPGFYTLRVGP